MNSRRLYSITSSARPSSESGMVIPSALGGLEIDEHSTFVDCWTGKSAGALTLRIRPA